MFRRSPPVQTFIGRRRSASSTELNHPHFLWVPNKKDNALFLCPKNCRFCRTNFCVHISLNTTILYLHFIKSSLPNCSFQPYQSFFFVVIIILAVTPETGVALDTCAWRNLYKKMNNRFNNRIQSAHTNEWKFNAFRFTFFLFLFISLRYLLSVCLSVYLSACLTLIAILIKLLRTVKSTYPD